MGARVWSEAKLEKGLAAPAAPPAAVAAAVRAVLPSTAAPSHSLEEIVAGPQEGLTA